MSNLASHSKTRFTIWKLFRSQRRHLAWASGCFILKHAPVWAVPLLSTSVIDILIRNDASATQRLLWVSGCLVGLICVYLPAQYYYGTFVSRAQRATEDSLRQSICEKLHRLPSSYFTRTSPAILHSKVLRDVDSASQFLTTMFEPIIASILTIAGALTVTAFTHPSFLAVYLISVPLAALIATFVHKPLVTGHGSMRQALEVLSVRVQTMIRMLPVTRAHGVESASLDQVRRPVADASRVARDLDRTQTLIAAASWMALSGCNVLFLLTLAWGRIFGKTNLTVGAILLLVTYFVLTTGAVMALLSSMPAFLRAREGLRSLGEVFDEREEGQWSGNIAIDALRGEIQFENVSHTFLGKSDPAIKGIDLSISQGEIIALVGRSGAGKSTILNIAAGILRPTSGNLLIDGHDLRNWSLQSYRKQIAVVSQDAILFDGSISDNVTFGLQGVSNEEVISALEQAQALEFVSQLPRGIDTHVGEDGATLSGGQRQRISLARALIRDPRILLLDEPTSALDFETERLLQVALHQLMRGRTSIIIAHRLSTLQYADRIVIMEKGKIVDLGTHASLLRTSYRFRALYDSQSTTPLSV